MNGPTMRTDTGFHAGEQALQARAGVQGGVAVLGARMLSDTLSDALQAFLRQLPFVVVGTVDTQGQPWASALTGAPGFADTPDDAHVRVTARRHPDDGLAQGLKPGAGIGLLGIEPHTRRRNRINGVITEVDGDGIGLRVAQCYGNCPQHITRRRPIAATAADFHPAARSGTLDAQALELVTRADTFFIATAHPDAGTMDPGAPAHGVDVSHRGGPAGFVRVARDAEGRDVLTIPDYAGNNFFNTWGNLALNPRAGLLFIDMERGDLLQLAVETELRWNGGGSTRQLRARLREMRRLPSALPLAWHAVG